MDWKIVLPENIINQVIKWPHQVLGHPGNKRCNTSYIGITTRISENSLTILHMKYVKNKNVLEDSMKLIPGKNYVTVDLIGSWAVEIRDK